MSDYIGSGIGQQGYQRHQDGQVGKQGQITGERRLPRQLPDSGESA
jgi:hypothetical protein